MKPTWTLSKVFNEKDIRYSLIIASAHLLVAILYTWGLGISIVAEPGKNTWDWFWQSIPVDLLKTEMLRSIWYLHSQPPLYNILMGILVKLFFPYHLQALQLINILLGTALSGMLYIIIVQMFPNRIFAFLPALVLAMHPSLFLYGAYILYSLFCAFLIVLNVFSLIWYRKTNSRLSLWFFIGSITVLILTRSLYNVVLIPAAFIFIFVLSNKNKRKYLIIVSSVLFIISLGWYSKNYFVFNIFGSSSWYGAGLWRMASADYKINELKTLSDKGILDKIVTDNDCFSKPIIYKRYGFNKTSDIKVLSRNDYNNINYPDISRVYFENSINLIKHDPIRTVKAIIKSYIIFVHPSSRYEHLGTNAAKIKYHEEFYTKILQGNLIMSVLTIKYGTIVLILLPCSLILYLIQLTVRYRTEKSIYSVIKAEAVMLWCFILVSYSTFISCSMEYGEGDRFKFDIKEIMWVFIVVVFYRSINWFKKKEANTLVTLT